MTARLFDLSQRVAVVTGGSKGLGFEIAMTLAEAGADVVVASRNLQECEAAAAKVRTTGRKSLAVAADVTRVQDCRTLIQKTVDTFGRLDVMVNNAGMNLRGPLIEVEEERYDQILGTNLKGLFFCSRFAAAQMQKNGWGRIINITSAAAILGVPMLGLYGAAKAGAAQLTKSCAIEWAPYGINVNAIGPYYIKTDLNRDFLAIPENYDAMAGKAALKRLGEPSDLKGLVLLLATDASAYITGQSFYLDGGTLAGWPMNWDPKRSQADS